MKHSRIWDTLLISNVELFVTIGIYKVIFCRLMTSYIPYSPMSVFICVSSLLVPFCSRWFHLQALEMMFFVTITIANVVFYWVMVLHVQFLPMNLFFFCVSLLMNQTCSRLFQVVPVHSRWFQLILGSSSSLQVVPTCSSLSYVFG